MLKSIKKIWILALAFLALPVMGSQAESAGDFPRQKLRKHRRQKLYITPEATREPAIKAIEGAKSHIVGSLFYLRDLRLTASLIKAAKHGVEVDIMIDRMHDTRTSEGLEKSHKIKSDLEEAGVRLHKTPGGYREVHRKVLCLDSQKSFITTGNFDTASFEGVGSRDASLILYNKGLTLDLEAHILGDMKGVPQVTQHASLISSNQRETLRKLIHSAERSLWVTQVDIQDELLCDALIQQAQKGVEVKLLLMPNPFGRMDRNTPNAERLSKYGVEIRVHDNGDVHAHKVHVDGCKPHPPSCSHRVV